MNKTATQHVAANHKDILLKIKENLREEVLQGVKTVGLRQRLFTEYYDLANTTSSLLALLQRFDFAGKLQGKDKENYDAIMTRLSCCGLRTQILVEQSSAEEYQALLQKIQPASDLAN